MKNTTLILFILLLPLSLFAQYTQGLEIIGDNSDEDVIAIKNNDYARYAAYGASNTDRFAIPCFVGFKSRGTFDAPANLLSQDRITGLYGGMYINGEYRISAAVEMFSGNNPGSGSYPAYIKFGTTPENGTSRVERMRIDEAGNVGIGTTTPAAKLEITDGDIYINDTNKGIIMKSPNGQCWRCQPDNNGQLVVTAAACP